MAQVFRVERNKNFTVMSNHHFKNKDLSLKAKGLLSLMLSLPEDWNYNMQGLASLSRDGIDSVRSAIKELEYYGYVERNMIRNIRLNLCDEQDRQAWEYLQTMDREKYKSYTRAVVVALNDYFSREYRNEADPYLETREKEDAFLERVETAIRDGVKESVPMAMAKNLLEMLAPFVKESVVGNSLTNGTLTVEKPDGEITEDNLDWEKEADMDAALDFADSF